MAPRFPRRRLDAGNQDPAPPRDPDNADLGAAEHEWWAQRDPKRPPSTPLGNERPGPQRDILADHLGEEWRARFGLDAPTSASDVDTSDPYAVLGVDHAATWVEIVIAHREEARLHHPDRMFGRSDAEVLRSEHRIRDINVAYQELRIRRGR